MSLTAASTLSHRAQCVRAASISGFTTSLSNRQQTRSYWFDRDSSNYFRNAYRRHAGLRSRCVETLQQGLSWNKESAPEENAAYIKRVTFGYWHKNQRKCFPGERWASTGSTLRTPDNPTGVRPGQNIEDAERAPLEGLLFGTPAETKPSWQQAKDKARARKAAKRTNAAVETDYVYDPIANRKVPISAVGQSSEEVDAPKASFKSYRSQFSTLQPPVLDDKQSPIFYDGPPPPSELEKYSHVEIDSSPWEGNTAKSSQEPASGTSSSTPSAPEVVRALENMQKEALGYQSDITTHSPLPPDVSVGAFQGNVGLGSEDPAGYTPFLSHEPDGMYKAVSEQEAQPEELTKYEAVRSHEPDGKYKVIEEDNSPSQELSKYGAVRSHEPDGKYKVVEEDNLSSQELSKYGAVRSHEPDGKYAVPYTDPVPDPAEVDHYSKPYLSHEPDGKYAASYAEPIIEDDAELARYQPFRSHEPDGKYAAEITTEDKQENLDQYQRGFRSHEPNGKYAAEADQVSEDSDLGNHEAFNSEDSKTLTMPSQKRGPTEDAAELETYKEVGHDEPVERNPANLWNKNSDARVQDAAGNKTEYRKLVEDLMARQAAEDDFHTSASDSSNPPSNGSDSTEGTSTGRRRLTGQYAQDFPEDFAVAWSTETSETKSSLLPTDIGSPSSTDLPTSGQPLPASALEPALGRHKSDPTSFPSASASRAEPQPTTLYKVLVYDPVMQAVDVAETTSVVSDSAAPLTPAEVLLRISNPARFFPHFAPLQAQGFEIVSGSGDVLIFRKVRDPVQSPEEAVKPAETISVTKDAPINPIDMTGGSPYNVAASRFASPTGFVNYELPLAETRSSGRSAEQRAGMERMAKSANEDLMRRLERLEKETKKKGLGKRMVIGGVSLAGLMYGFGLAGDSVKHGRMEVKGPNQKT